MMKNVLMMLSWMMVAVHARTVIIGDSLFWSGPLFWGGQSSPLVKWLEERAGHAIENYALVGASLSDGWVKSIRQQYMELDHTTPITTLIMDGGGNDVMSHRQDCEKWTPRCQEVVAESGRIVEEILHRARSDSVANVVYLGFYDIPGLMTVIDRGNTIISTACKNSSGCIFVDPRYNATSGTGLPTPQYLGSDGIHPTQEGYHILAHQVYETMEQNHIPI